MIKTSDMMRILMYETLFYLVCIILMIVGHAQPLISGNIRTHELLWHHETEASVSSPITHSIFQGSQGKSSLRFTDDDDVSPQAQMCAIGTFLLGGAVHSFGLFSIYSRIMGDASYGVASMILPLIAGSLVAVDSLARYSGYRDY
jgi:hypothetical protein